MIIRTLLDVAATYRLTKLVIDDEITADLRDAVYARVPSGGKIAYMLSCPWCVSFWAGMSIFTLRRLAPEAVSDILSGALAASAVTGLAYEHL